MSPESQICSVASASQCTSALSAAPSGLAATTDAQEVPSGIQATESVSLPATRAMPALCEVMSYTDRERSARREDRDADGLHLALQARRFLRRYVDPRKSEAVCTAVDARSASSALDIVGQ